MVHHVTKGLETLVQPLRLNIQMIDNRHKIHQINFTRRKLVNRDILDHKLRMEDVLPIHFEQIVSFCAIMYSNINSFNLFCENSSLPTNTVFFYPARVS